MCNLKTVLSFLKTSQFSLITFLSILFVNNFAENLEQGGLLRKNLENFVVHTRNKTCQGKLARIHQPYIPAWTTKFINFAPWQVFMLKN